MPQQYHYYTSICGLKDSTIVRIKKLKRSLFDNTTLQRFKNLINIYCVVVLMYLPRVETMLFSLALCVESCR